MGNRRRRRREEGVVVVISSWRRSCIFVTIIPTWAFIILGLVMLA